MCHWREVQIKEEFASPTKLSKFLHLNWSEACRELVSIIRRRHRRYLLAGIFALLRPLGYVDLAHDFLLKLLSYGDKDFHDSVNRHILELTLNFIHKTGRFD